MLRIINTTLGREDGLKSDWSISVSCMSKNAVPLCGARHYLVQFTQLLGALSLLHQAFLNMNYFFAEVCKISILFLPAGSQE